MNTDRVTPLGHWSRDPHIWSCDVTMTSRGAHRPMVVGLVADNNAWL